MRIRALAPLLLLSSVAFAAQSSFAPEANTWTLTNGWIQATLQFTNGRLTEPVLRELLACDVWRPPSGAPSTLIRMQAGNEVYDRARMYKLTDQHMEQISTAGIRQVIVLEDLDGTARFTVSLEMYDGQPALRYRIG